MERSELPRVMYASVATYARLNGCVATWSNEYTTKFKCRERITRYRPSLVESGGNYIATSNNMKLVHWPLMGGLLRFIGTTRRGLDGAAAHGAHLGSSSLYQM